VQKKRREKMTAGNWSRSSKKSIREQVIAILSLIFAVILISIIAIPQVLEAFSRLIYRRRKSKDVRGKLAVVRKILSFAGDRTQ
jgi:hypothetical protein